MSIIGGNKECFSTAIFQTNNAAGVDGPQNAAIQAKQGYRSRRNWQLTSETLQKICSFPSYWSTPSRYSFFLGKEFKINSRDTTETLII